MNSRILTTLFALILVLTLTVSAYADVIHLKDGSVIRGQIIGFRDQQFVVLVGSGARGRRSQITIYMEDVDTIEFDSAGNVPTVADNNNGQGNMRPSPQPTNTRPPVQQPVNTQPDDSLPSSSGQPSTSPGSSLFVTVFNKGVRADNAANGWTSTGFAVHKGQRIRITASGRVSLGGGRVSTPAGVPALQDSDKLMRSYPTGALIAVIGDDNDDFIFIGQKREFIAQREGVLFLGVNEGNLNDNSGAYDVLVEAETMGGTR